MYNYFTKMLTKSLLIAILATRSTYATKRPIDDAQNLKDTQITIAEVPIDSPENSWKPKMLSIKKCCLAILSASVFIVYLSVASVSAVVDNNEEERKPVVAARVYDDQWAYCMLQNTDINAKNEWGNTALLYSAYYGELACVQYLLKEGADIYASNQGANTALMASAQEGHLACVQYLVEQGADVYAKNENGYTALRLSMLSQNLDIVSYLVETRDANIHDKNRVLNKGLLLSLHHGCFDCLEYIIKHETDIDAATYNRKREASLLFSVRNENLACLKAVVEQGAGFNSKNKNNTTVQHWTPRYAKSLRNKRTDKSRKKMSIHRLQSINY